MFRKRFYFSSPALGVVREEMSSAPPTHHSHTLSRSSCAPPPAPRRPICCCFSRDSDRFESCRVPLSVPGIKVRLGLALWLGSPGAATLPPPGSQPPARAARAVSSRPRRRALSSVCFNAETVSSPGLRRSLPPWVSSQTPLPSPNPDLAPVVSPNRPRG